MPAFGFGYRDMTRAERHPIMSLKRSVIGRNCGSIRQQRPPIKLEVGTISKHFLLFFLFSALQAYIFNRLSDSSYVSIYTNPQCAGLLETTR